MTIHEREFFPVLGRLFPEKLSRPGRILNGTDKLTLKSEPGMGNYSNDILAILLSPNEVALADYSGEGYQIRDEDPIVGDEINRNPLTKRKLFWLSGELGDFSCYDTQDFLKGIFLSDIHVLARTLRRLDH